MKRKAYIYTLLIDVYISFVNAYNIFVFVLFSTFCFTFLPFFLVQLNASLNELIPNVSPMLQEMLRSLLEIDFKKRPSSQILTAVCFVCFILLMYFFQFFFLSIICFFFFSLLLERFVSCHSSSSIYINIYDDDIL